MHTCSTCGRDESKVRFYIRYGRPRGTCVSCARQYEFEKRSNGRTPEQMALDNPCRVKNFSFLRDGALVRVCSECKETLPEENFRRNRRLYGRCNECQKKVAAIRRAAPEKALAARERAREWNAKKRDPDKIRWALILKNYGLTKGMYEERLKSQGGGCAICGALSAHDTFGNLAVDHCHKTGVVRGLLCNKCN